MSDVTPRGTMDLVPSYEQVEERMQEYEATRKALHLDAIERGEYEIHLENDMPPIVVTEFMREAVSIERIEQLGIRCHIAGRNALCPTCGQPADVILK